MLSLYVMIQIKLCFLRKSKEQLPAPPPSYVTVFKTNVKLSLCFYDTTQL